MFLAVITICSLFPFSSMAEISNAEISPETETAITTVMQEVHTNDLHTRQGRVCKAAGLQHRSFHKIRKTWVSSLLTIKSIPIINVKEMAGHESAEMTLNVYGKTITPDSKIKAEMEKALPSFEPAESKIS